MSDEPKRRSRAWIGKTLIVLAFFCVNVLAAYASTPLLLREISFDSHPKDAFFRVPVALAYVAVENYARPNPWGSFEHSVQAERDRLLIGRGLTVAFLLELFVASAALCNSRWALLPMPIIVVIYSLLQGLIVAVIDGLNALGGG